jgi:hypothetical protein
MNTRFPLAMLAIVTLSACAGDGSTAAPYGAGLIWTLNESSVETITTYRKVAGGEAVVAGTPIGAGSSCSIAQAPTGGSAFTGTLTAVWTNEVVGNTSAHHPLKPGQDVFNGVGVSVVAEMVEESAVGTTTLDFAQEDEDGDLLTWQDIAAAPGGIQTTSRYHGVSADEYIVSQGPIDLWSTWEDDSIDENDDAEGDEFVEGTPGRRFDLLSKTKPKTGDIWTSTNGNVLYVFDGTEKLDVGGKSVNANRILVYTVDPFDATAGDVLAECFQTGPVEFTSTFPEVDDVLTDAMSLDAGCTDRFMHQQIGTEWWANNALVKFEGRRVMVEITSFGWEWYVDDEDLEFCTRFTNTTRPVDEPNAQQYVEYVVTVEDTTVSLGSWTEGSAKE